MKSVGEKLRRERLQRGMDIAKVASLTRISQKYLEAIEAGNKDQLPSGFFYRSFVRQYADTLGLDVAEIEKELERVREAEAPVLSAALEQAQFPIKPLDPIVTEGNRRGKGRLGAYVALLAVVLIGCSAFYAWWHRLETATANREKGIVIEQPVSPPHVPAATPEPVPPPVEKAATTPDAGITTSDVGVTMTPVDSAASSPKAPAISPDDKVVIKIAATEVTWIAITADGKTIFSGLLQPSQELTLGGKERAMIRVGNAGGLALSWNGKTIGPVGARGQVRNVVLTPESYRITAPDGSL
jgi:cytoskeleton protein RodZ